MYNDELDMALESAYEDGYYQALADMGYEFDDVEEDVDIFDEDCFDEAMEGNADNKASRHRWERDTGAIDERRGYNGGKYGVAGMIRHNLSKETRKFRDGHSARSPQRNVSRSEYYSKRRAELDDPNHQYSSKKAQAFADKYRSDPEFRSKYDKIMDKYNIPSRRRPSIKQ